jgi:hypothetical protein
MMEQVLASTAAWALILEDDVAFAADFRDRLDAVLAALPPGWDFVQLGWLPTHHDLRRSTRFRRRVAGFGPARQLAHLVKPITPVEQDPAPRSLPSWGTHCYLVSRTFAERVAEARGTHIWQPIDWFYRYFLEVADLGTSPLRYFKARSPIAGQNWALGSDVDPARFLAQDKQIDENGKVVHVDNGPTAPPGGSDGPGAPLRVLAVDPYEHLGGHHPRAVLDAVAAFGSIGVAADRVDASPSAPGLEISSRALSRGVRALRRAAKAAPPWIGDRAVPRLDRGDELVRRLASELPAFLATRAFVSDLVANGQTPLVLVCSSYVRPIWIPSLLIGRRTATVQQVFEPLPPERRPGFAPLPAVAAATRRIDETVRRSYPGGRSRVVAHFPLVDPVPVEACDVGRDLVELVQRARGSGGRVVLSFGILHGKKDTRSLIRAAVTLPADVFVLLVGDPAWEGTHLPPDLAAILREHPNVLVCFRGVTEAERHWCFANCDVVAIPQLAGVA